MQDSCIIPVVEEEIICPQPQIQVQEKVVVPAIPDDHNLDLYMELPEQEALELQEKYNIENGNYYNNR